MEARTSRLLEDAQASVLRRPKSLPPTARVPPCSTGGAPAAGAKPADCSRPKRRKDLRAALVSFWNWAKLEGIAGPDAITPAQRLPNVKVDHGKRFVMTPAQMELELQHVLPRFRINIVLEGFAGMRPEEVAPPSAEKDRKKGKRGIHGEDLDSRFGTIEVPPEVAKTGLPRTIPMNEALHAGLEWAGIREGHTGHLALANLSDEEESLRLGKARLRCRRLAQGRLAALLQ